MDQDLSHPSSGIAVNQGHDPMGSGGADDMGSGGADEEDIDGQFDLIGGPDPGCQELDNSDQDNGLDDPDRDPLEPGNMPDGPAMADDPPGLAQNELPPSQPQGQGTQTQSSLNLEELDGIATLTNLKITMAFIKAIASASLDDEHSQLDPLTLERIRNPPTSIPTLSDNPGMCLGLDIFLSLTNAAQGTYTSIRNAILKRYPEDEMPSYEQVKGYISEVTGVFSVEHHMCINSCLAFTGPYKHLDVCPECAEVRYDVITKKAHQVFQTILLGPLLQALKLNEQSAEALLYCHILQSQINELLKKYDGELPWLEDIMHGHAFNEAVNSGKIKKDDLILMFSFDGAQLYANKASDCWIFIWVIFDHAPDGRYIKKCVLPGGFITGPNKPKYPDTYLFPSLHHLSALQTEGLRMWDANQQKIVTSHPFLCLATADGPGMAYLNGLVGHHGKKGC
jgi:hypothetical protein